VRLKFSARDFDKTASAAAALLIELVERFGDEDHRCFDAVMGAAEELWVKMLRGEINRAVSIYVTCVTPGGAARFKVEAQADRREVVIEMPGKPIYIHTDEEGPGPEVEDS